MTTSDGEYSTDETFSSENTESDSLATSETGGGDNSGINPAWSPLLDILPEQYRQMETVQNTLKGWDQNYEKLQQEYQPFKDLPEQYRSPERITQAMTVLSNLEANPHQVLQLLAENLGVSLAEAKEIVEEAKEPELEFSEDDDPRLPAMAKQIKEFKEAQQQFFEQQVQREEERMIAEEAKVQGAAIDDQVRGIIDAGHYGNTKEQQGPLIQDLMLRADYAFKQGSRDPIGDAFKAQQAVFGVVAQRVAPQAPKQNLLFMPASSGAAPENQGKGPNLDTEQGRSDAARAIRDMLARQG
jgi:DNA-binding transcriptional MerR regulator